MFNKVIGTIVSRLLIALLSLGIIIINSKQLGAAAMGTISLIILAIAIIQLVNSLVGGPALTYLVPRFDIYKLFVPSIIWAIITSVICTAILFFLGLIPAGYFKDVLLISFIMSLSAICLNIIVGKEKMKLFNIISALQTIILIGVLAYFLFYLGKKEVRSYIIALYISNIFITVVSLIAVLRFIKISDLANMKEVLHNIFKFGSFGFLANVIQQFNYRLTYYIIDKFISTSSLGLYSVGVQLSEGLWITGKSLAIVQYARISNITDYDYARKITLAFAKISFLITFVLLGILLLIPHQFFSAIFGKDFHDLPVVILSLGSGILFLSLSFSFSHYFSGTGKYHHNTISSSIGFVFTIVLGFTLIPAYGLVGAGITTSIAYLSILVYQIIFFLRISGSKLKELLITAADIRLFVTEFRGWIGKKKS